MPARMVGADAVKPRIGPVAQEWPHSRPGSDGQVFVCVVSKLRAIDLTAAQRFEDFARTRGGLFLIRIRLANQNVRYAAVDRGSCRWKIHIS